MIKKVSFLGFDISVFTKDELEEFVKKSILHKEPRIIYGHSLGSISLVKDVPEYYCYGNKSDILLADGRPFYYFAKLSGAPLVSKMSIPESVLFMLQLANTNNWSVFLLGGTLEVNSKAQEIIKRDYSGISAVNGSEGYFSKNEWDDVVSLINKESPDIVLIGLPSPKKEIISIEWKHKLKASIIIPCGGMIDVLAGKSKMTPSIIKRLGLASLYRLVQEPRRLGKRYARLYYKLLFVILPLSFWNIVLKGNRKFSLVEYFKIECKNVN